MAAIPGLGQIPAEPTATSARRISLRPFGEWRFQTALDLLPPVEVRLLSGTAEKDGTELALQHTYTFAGVQSRILSWHGCELEVTGKCESEAVVQHGQPADTAMVAYLNLHGALDSRRTGTGHGPRVLIAGGPSTGKSSLARTLVSWATRVGGQPLVVNVDPRAGMLALPGTIAAAVFATLMDIESIDGWGAAPTTGPGAAPPKLPLVYHFGHAKPGDDIDAYKQAVGRLATAATARLSADPEVRRTGMVVDTPAVGEGDGVDVDVLAHVVEELSINIVVVLGSPHLYTSLQKRLGGSTTTLNEPVEIVDLAASDGVVRHDEEYVRLAQETMIKEYFFGDSRAALSPSTQTVEAESLLIYRLADDSIYDDEADDTPLIRIPPSEEMEASILAVMAAHPRDVPETVRAAPVLGFVYVADVDKERGRVRILAPVGGGGLAERVYVWGRWPEAFFNLLA